MFAITSIYAALLALVFLWLSLQVIGYRRKQRLSLGDEGDRRLLRLMRAQANCAEYTPIGVVLLALCEAQGVSALGLHVLGLSLLAARILHGWGFSRRPSVHIARVIGTGLTLLMILAAALILLVVGLT